MQPPNPGAIHVARTLYVEDKLIGAAQFIDADIFPAEMAVYAWADMATFGS